MINLFIDGGVVNFASGEDRIKCYDRLQCKSVYVKKGRHTQSLNLGTTTVAVERLLRKYIPNIESIEMGALIDYHYEGCDLAALKWKNPYIVYSCNRE